jgi:hypothetical protein
MAMVLKNKKTPPKKEEKERKKTYPFHSNQIPKSKSISIRGGKKKKPKISLNPKPYTNPHDAILDASLKLGYYYVVQTFNKGSCTCSFL